MSWIIQDMVNREVETGSLIMRLCHSKKVSTIGIDPMLVIPTRDFLSYSIPAIVGGGNKKHKFDVIQPN